jgi:DNA-binding transcriptional MerR regulator
MPITHNPHEEAVDAYHRALEALEKEREVAQEQSKFLDSYGKTLDCKNINIEDVERFLDMFGPRQVAVAKRIQELDDQIAQIEQEIEEAGAKVDAGPQGAKRDTKITVTVLAETDGHAELMVTYSAYHICMIHSN